MKNIFLYIGVDFMYKQYMKRCLDILLSVLALVLLSPVMLLTAILVRAKLGTPILFVQERPGKYEQIFKLLKFRTMTEKRDGNGELLPDEERLTKFGRFLRTTSLDELPELFNIVKGDMSIVGPRPLLVRYLSFYKKEERIRHSVRPGLTGLAQINGRNNLSWDDRLALDIRYVKTISFTNDLKIIYMTIRKVLNRSDIASGNQMIMQDLDMERKK